MTSSPHSAHLAGALADVGHRPRDGDRRRVGNRLVGGLNVADGQIGQERQRQVNRSGTRRLTTAPAPSVSTDLLSVCTIR